MKKLFLITLLLSSCAHKPKPIADNKNTCFLLYDMKKNELVKVIGEHCQTRLTACSTFKVPLSLMFFDSKVLKTPDSKDEVAKWDGTKHAIVEWNQDQTPASWMKHSVVWYSQKLTPKLGLTKLKKYLADFNYGNQDMSGGLTTAWLTSFKLANATLKISPNEQLEFMKKFWGNELPVSKQATDVTKSITFLETTPHGYRLSGKTGSGFLNEEKTKRIGWFVAHLENVELGEEFVSVVGFADQDAGVGRGYGGFEAKEMMKTYFNDLGLW